MLERLWDFIDKRQIDKHIVSILIMYGTVQITKWSMVFAVLHPDSNGVIVIASVDVPYMALQAAALKSYFDARSQNA